MSKDSKVLYEHQFEVIRVEHKDVEKEEDASHTEKATLTTGTGEKIALTMAHLPKGVAQGQKLTVIFTNKQTTLDDHAK